MKADDIRIYRQLGCDACPLAKLRNRNPRMEPTGSDEPTIYVLGGAPNYEDDVRGRQFTGESGEVLRKIFRDIIGLDYKHIIRFNNIVRTRCHEGGEDKAPPWEAIEACRPSIIADIEETKPKAIFGFGNLPLEWIADISGIYAWRGRYMAVRVGNHVCWYFPMIHPDDVQNAGVRIFHDDDAASDEESFLNEDHRILRLDIQHAWKRLQELGTPFIHTPDYARQGVEILDFYDEKGLTIIENKLKHFGQQLVVGIDYETTALRPYNSNAMLLSAAVSDGQSAFAFPFDHPSAEWTRKHKERLRELWRDFLKTTKAIKAVHNLQFEQEWTVYHFGWELAHAGDWHCTQVQASIIDHRYKGSEPSPLSLDFLVRQHFGLNLKAMSNVDRSNLIRTPLPIVLEYNALDAKYHALLYKRQHSIIMKENLTMAYKFARRRVPAIVLAQIKGVPVSQKRAEKLYEKYSTRIHELEDSIANDKTVKKFETKYKQTFNPNSNADCVKLFYTMLGRKECEVYDKKKKNVKPWLGGVDGKTKVNKISCDKEVLTQLEHPLADKILALRKPQKLLSTYVLPLMKGTDESKIYDDGKLHPIFNHTFTDTGRLSCIRKGTPVQVPGGTKPIEEIKIGDWVYTYDENRKITLRRVTNVWYRGRKPIVRVHWIGQGHKHSGFLDCTPDHRIRLITGEYVRADELVPAQVRTVTRNGKRIQSYRYGSRVLALHREVSDYNMLYVTGVPYKQKEARVVFKAVYGYLPEHVHHADGNKHNDHPDNLVGMTQVEHARHHMRAVSSIEKRRRALARSPEAKRRNAEAVRRAVKQRAKARWTKEQIIAALEQGNGVLGAARILNADYSSVRARMREWNIVYDGRTKRKVRPERRGRRIGPYKGKNNYSPVWQRHLDRQNNHMIIGLEYLSGQYPVYDIEVEGTHNFIAGELCVHNCEEPNMQNFPKRSDESKEVRCIIKPPKGHVVLSIDYGQIEARVIAMYTRDKRFCQALWERYDVHGEWAERIAYAYPQRVGGKAMLKDKKAMKDFRTDIKNQWTFPLFFGAQLASVSKYLHIPEDVLRPLYDAFWKEFEGVKSWQDNLIKFYEENGYVETFTGRRRYGPMNVNKVINSPVQGFTCEFVLDGMCRLSETGDPLLQPEIQIHDDLTWVAVPVDKVDYVAEKALEILLTPAPEFKDFICVPITLEMSVGEDWLNMEEIGVFSSDDK